MRKVNEFVEMLRAETLKKIREQMKSDAAAYKTLIKDLLVQVSHIQLFILTLGGFIGFGLILGGGMLYIIGGIGGVKVQGIKSPGLLKFGGFEKQRISIMQSQESWD